MDINDDIIYYLMISNIPKTYHSSDLRNYFSQYIEAGKFDCFHFRHRPEIRKPESKDDNTTKPSNNKENLHSTTCCITKVKGMYIDELITLYNRKHWVDRSDESLSTLCCISIIKISPKINECRYKTRRERVGVSRSPVDVGGVLGETDFESLLELRPPTAMPRGNVGTPLKWFLAEIKACRLPPSIISKLGLVFPATRKFRRYGEVNFDYRKLNRYDEALLLDEEGSFGVPKTSRGGEIESENQFIKKTASAEIDADKKNANDSLKLTELEEQACEDWERHLALNDDVDNHFERNKQREFECDMEVTWEKGGSGLVFYTDAAYWAKEKGDFDEQTADDWDVDMSIYEHTQFDARLTPGGATTAQCSTPPSRRSEVGRATGDLSSSHCSTGDMDARDAMSMRRMQRLKEGKDIESVCGYFEKHTRGIGRNYLRSKGWSDGQGIGKKEDGITESVEVVQQIDKHGLGYYGEKLRPYQVQVKAGREDEDDAEEAEFASSDSLYLRSHPLNIKY